MPCSMTAFARRECLFGERVISCEIRTVNHRYLDLALRMSEAVKPLEAMVAEKIRRKLSRGRVECAVVVQQPDASALKIDDKALDALAAETLRITQRLSGMGLDLAPPSVSEVVKLGHITGLCAPPPVDSSGLDDAVAVLVDQALDCLVESRKAEGSRLQKFILGQRDELAKLVAMLRERYPQALAAAREKFRRKLAELAGINADLDPQRMAQEAVLLAHKVCTGADIEEELDRCDSHMQELDAIFRRTGPVGRRLDFLVQELNREINTIASKSVDVETSHTAVAAKTLTEQMREQVQNIE